VLALWADDLVHDLVHDCGFIFPLLTTCVFAAADAFLLRPCLCL
jgi:hypothetical protein